MRNEISNQTLVSSCDDVVPKTLPISPYLDAEQSAAYLGITVNALYGWVERGKLRKMKGYRAYRFTREMLDKALMGEVEPTVRRRKRR